MKPRDPDIIIPTILVVDDEPPIHSALKLRLGESYRVISVFSPREALGQLKDESPDLSLLKEHAKYWGQQKKITSGFELTTNSDSPVGGGFEIQNGQTIGTDHFDGCASHRSPGADVLHKDITAAVGVFFSDKSKVRHHNEAAVRFVAGVHGGHFEVKDSLSPGRLLQVGI